MFGYIAVCLSVLLPGCVDFMSVCLSVCQYVYLFGYFCLTVFLSLLIGVYLDVYMSVCLPDHLNGYHLSFWMLVCHLDVCLCV